MQKRLFALILALVMVGTFFSGIPTIAVAATNSIGIQLKNASDTSLGITLYSGMDQGHPWYEEGWGAHTTLTGSENNPVNPAIALNKDHKSFLLIFDQQPNETASAGGPATSTALTADNALGGVLDVPTITYLGMTDENPKRYAYKVEFDQINGSGKKPFHMNYLIGEQDFEILFEGDQGGGNQGESLGSCSRNYKLEFNDGKFMVMLGIAEYMEQNLVVSDSGFDGETNTATIVLTVKNDDANAWTMAADECNNGGNLMFGVYIAAPASSTNCALTNAADAATAYAAMRNAIDKINEDYYIMGVNRDNVRNNYTITCGGDTYPVGSPDAFSVATAVEKVRKKVIYPESSSHGICTIFTDDNYKVVEIRNLNIVVNVEDGFEKQEVPGTNYVSEDRLTFDAGNNDYSGTYDAASGVLQYTVGLHGAELNDEKIDQLEDNRFHWNFATVTSPTDYPYLTECGAVGSSMRVMGRNNTCMDEAVTLWTDGKADGNTGNLISRVNDFTYFIRWRNESGEEYVEYITLSKSDISNPPAIEEKGYTKIESSRTDIQDVIAGLDEHVMKLEYNSAAGLYRLTFGDKIPTPEELNTAVKIYAPAGAVSYKRVGPMWSTSLYNQDTANRLVNDINNAQELFAEDLPEDENGAYIEFPLVDVRETLVDGVHVFYVATTQPRSFLVEWYDGSGNPLTKEYFCGFNNSASWESVEPSRHSGLATAPYIVAAEGIWHLRCTYSPQADGEGEAYYYQLDVDEMQAVGQTYTVCLPYSFIGESADYSYCVENLTAPVIRHYNEMHTDYETITGRYTEDGILFEVTSFSPFTLNWAEKTVPGNNPGHYHGGTTTVNAPDTGDAGIALYGVMSVMSLMGMGYLGKRKKH